MALQNLLGDLNLEASQQELLAQTTYLLASILDKMPRIDSNERAIVNTSDQRNVTVALATSQVLATLTNQAQLGGRDMSHAQVATANASTTHIYNNIIVS